MLFIFCAPWLRCSGKDRGIGIVCPICLFHASDDLVVFGRRQDANEGHHSHHVSAPSSRKAVVLGLVYHLVHGHHRTLHIGVLREVGDGVCVLGDVTLHVVHAGHLTVIHVLHRRVCLGF